MIAPPATPPASAPETRTAATGRDSVLDLLRALALFRVVAWHAFAATWLTVIAAMPVMFFVAGVLLRTSMEGGGYGRTLSRRMRRILLPLWVYGVAVAAAMIVADLGDAAWTKPTDILFRAATWVLPLLDPADSTWHGGWLSNHLWYIRAYLWMVLLAPFLLVLARRLWIGCSLLVVWVAQAEVAAAFDVPVLGSSYVRVVAGDFVTYGLFVVLGMAWAGRRSRVSPVVLGLLAVVATAGSVAFVDRYGLPEGGVNSSYPAILLTGLAWLAAAGLFERPLRAVAGVPFVDRAARAVSRRALTIYLWHPPAIVVAYATVDLPGAAGTFAIAGITLGLTAVAVVAVGWVEDVASGRRSATNPLQLARAAVIVPAAAAVLIVSIPALVLPATDPAAASTPTRAGVRPPSYREALGDSAFGRRPPAARDAPFRLEDGKMPAKELQRALHRWIRSQRGLESVTIAVQVEGQLWQGSASKPDAGVVTRARDRYPVFSLAKTFTAALVLREVERGRIALDAPVPRLRAVGSPPRGVVITPRQLLQHTSGLVEYTTANRYREDQLLTPQRAVADSLRTPLVAPPGSGVHYANTNYLYLGLLLEHVTRTPYPRLVEELAGSLGLPGTRVEYYPRPGWVGFSSSGVHSTVAELVRWGDALLTPGRVLQSPALVAELTTIGETNASLGLWPICPCWTDELGTKRYTAIGHTIGSGGMYHYPRQMMLAIRFEPGTEHANDLVAALGEEIAEVFRRQR